MLQVSIPRPRASPSQRISASNVIERHTAPLDARSAVALEFASYWCHKHATIKPAPAVIFRRALQLLAGHLSSLEGEDIAAETRAFRDAGRGEGSALTLTQARARIEDHIAAPARQRMDDWRDALHAPEERRQMSEMLVRLEALMAEGA